MRSTLCGQGCLCACCQRVTRVCVCVCVCDSFVSQISDCLARVVRALAEARQAAERREPLVNLIRDVSRGLEEVRWLKTYEADPEKYKVCEPLHTPIHCVSHGSCMYEPRSPSQRAHGFAG